MVGNFQQDILAFQKDYAGLDVSNYEKAKNCKKIVDAQKKLLQGGVS